MLLYEYFYSIYIADNLVNNNKQSWFIKRIKKLLVRVRIRSDVDQIGDAYVHRSLQYLCDIKEFIHVCEFYRDYFEEYDEYIKNILKTSNVSPKEMNNNADENSDNE